MKLLKASIFTTFIFLSCDGTVSFNKENLNANNELEFLDEKATYEKGRHDIENSEIWIELTATDSSYIKTLHENALSKNWTVVYSDDKALLLFKKIDNEPITIKIEKTNSAVSVKIF